MVWTMIIKKNVLIFRRCTAKHPGSSVMISATDFQMVQENHAHVRVHAHTHTHSKYDKILTMNESR